MNRLYLRDRAVIRFNVMMRRWIIVCSIFILAAPLRAQQQESAAVEQPVDDPEKLRQESLSRLEADHRDFPTIKSQPIERIVQLKLEDGMIVLRTDLPQTVSKARIEIESMPGFATLHIQGKPKGGADTLPRHFELTHYSFTTPGAISVQTQVFSSVGYLQISRTVDGLSEDSMVQFIQTQQPFGLDIMTGEDSAKLYVNVVNKLTDARIADLNLTAANVVELRRRYPRETSLYLQPILRDIGQDATVFAADTRAAWQVFAPSVKPDDELMRTLATIVAEFDADDFRQRESAQAKLEALGQPAAVALTHYDRRELSDEQNSRIDTFLAPYRPLSDDEAARQAQSPAFMLDCLLTDDADIREIAKRELERMVDEKVEFDPGANAIQRSEAVARLRAKIMSPTSQPQ